MSIFKKRQFWISVIISIGVFVITYPFYHDMYISELFTVICVLLNLFSSVLFGAFLYFILTKSMDSEIRKSIFAFIVVQVIAHVIFSIMNWGSYLFLLLSAFSLIYIIVSYFKEKKPG